MFTKFKFSKKALLPIIIITVIIYAMSLMFPSLAETGRRLRSSFDLYRALFTFLTFCIGLLIEFDRITNAFKKGFKLKPFGILISIAILIILFLPATVGMTITGFGTMAIIMQQGFFRGILALISGLVFARSI